ncbi:hypothetical protein, conserved, partial [Trypanosoma cruzi]
MLEASRVRLLNRQTQKYMTKLRYRFRRPQVLPLRQTAEQRRNTILRFCENVGYPRGIT